MDPFAHAFDERVFFPSAAHTEAVARLEYAVGSRAQFAVLTGELGSGKTFVWEMLTRQAPREKHAFVTFPSPPRMFGELVATVLRALGRSPEAGGSWRPLERALNSLPRTRRALALVMDEAQELTREFLLELRNMTNLSPCSLTVLLVGQPELRAKLKSLPQVDSRVGLRYHLGYLGPEEVAPYVRHRLSVSGARAEFDDAACAALAGCTCCSPREINFFAGLALARAGADERNVVTCEDVEAVAADVSLQAG